MTAFLVHTLQTQEVLPFYLKIILNFVVSKIKGDSERNQIILEFTTEGKKLLLCFIYGPNYEDPSFYTNIQEYILDSKGDIVIICGDFNLVLNPELDCYNYKHVQLLDKYLLKS